MKSKKVKNPLTYTPRLEVIEHISMYYPPINAIGVETDDYYTYFIDCLVAPYDYDEIEVVQRNKNWLIIKGKKKINNVIKEGKYLNEIEYPDEFERILEFGINLNESEIASSYNNGILHITVTFKKVFKEKKIKIERKDDLK